MGSVLESAIDTFANSGLIFPEIPDMLAAKLKNIREWLFSTREIKVSPYNLKHYVFECEKASIEDYAIIGHSGHGVNSYAIQYYLVYGPLCMFLHLAWGGAYRDSESSAGQIRDCFSLADQITKRISGSKMGSKRKILLVGSDFYGSYWSTIPAQDPMKNERSSPADVLNEVRDWLERNLEFQL